MSKSHLEIAFFILVLSIALFLFFLILEPYLGAIVLAGTLALLFHPLYRNLLRIIPYKSLAACMVVIAAIIIVLLPLGFFGARILSEATTVYGSLASNGGFNLGTALARLGFNAENLPLSGAAFNFQEIVRQTLTWLIQNLGSFFSSITQALLTVFLSLLGLFYFLKDGERLKKWIVDFVPLPPEYTESVMRETSAITNSVMKGIFIVSIVQGIAAGIGFALFGVPNAVFWGALLAFFSLIPMVGAWLVVVPIIIYLFLAQQIVPAVGLALWSLVFLNLIGNVLAPQLMRRGTNIPPYIILLSVLGGINIFGPMGFLIGPIIVALMISLLNVYPRFMLKKDS